MGHSPKARRPAPTPPPIPPVSAEDPNVKLAGDEELRRLSRRRGRKSTLLQPYNPQTPSGGGSQILGG